MGKNKSFYILYQVLVLILIISACDSDSKKSKEFLIFKYNESSGISSLDPAFARVQSAIWPVTQVFSCLVELNNGNLLPKPLACKRWETLNDGLIYRFELKTNIYFHKHPCFGKDSTRFVEANDWVYSFNRLVDPKLASPGSWIMQMVDSVYAENDSVLVFLLKEKFPAFTGMLSMAYCSVVPKEVVECLGSQWAYSPIGTGPFIFKKWLLNEKLVLRRNSNYFETDHNGHAMPYLDAISIRFLPDKQSAFLELIKGKIDFVSGLDPSYVNQVLTEEGKLSVEYSDFLELSESYYLNTEYLGFALKPEAYPDGDKSPYLNPLVRRAINYAFDRTEMVKYLRRNAAFPAQSGFIPPALPGAYLKKMYTYSPDSVIALLNRAGYPNGTGLTELKLFTTAPYQDLCEYIQASLSRFNIPIRIELLPASALRQGMANGKLSTFRGSWIADYPDAQNYLSLFYSKNAAPNGPNYTFYSSDAFDSIYNKTLGIQNDSIRFGFYKNLDSLVVYNAPIVPLYYDKVYRFYQKGWKNLEPNAINSLQLKHTYKLPR